MADMHVDNNSHFMQAAQAIGDAMVKQVDRLGDAVMEHADALIGGFMDKLTGMVEGIGSKVSNAASGLKDKALALVPNRPSDVPAPAKQKEIAPAVTPPQQNLAQNEQLNTALAKADFKLPEISSAVELHDSHIASPTHSPSVGGPSVGQGMSMTV